MRSLFQRRGRANGWALLIATAAITSGAPPPEGGPARGTVFIRQLSYHQWAEAWSIANGVAEVVVVPKIGRLMQFHFLGEEGPLWENRALDGKSPNSKAKEWGNFGGDKTWPAPQADWGKITDRSWPPPAFDSMPVKVERTGRALVLRSPVDPFYGIRTERRVELDPDQAKLMITTRYEKVSGPASLVSIWVITQCQEPVAVFAPASMAPGFPLGYQRQSDQRPPSLDLRNGLLSLKRDPRAAYKIGTAADELLWVGSRWVLSIQSSRETSGNFPDGGASAEIYTNPDPLPYVELELLGPLRRMRAGESFSRKNVYRLFHRRYAEPGEEARHLLGR